MKKWAKIASPTVEVQTSQKRQNILAEEDKIDDKYEMAAEETDSRVTVVKYHIDDKTTDDDKQVVD